MTNLLSPRFPSPDHESLITRLSLVLVTCLLLLCAPGRAQTSVVLSPIPIQQLFDGNGRPLAFGCVFSYQVATSTPLSTYTDYTGTTLNANPLILSASGTYSMWLQAGVSYSLVVKSAGGSNCSSGSTISFLNGVGGGSTTLTTIVPYTSTPAFQVAAQNQLFEITLTGNASAQPLTFVGVTPPSYVVFQITQDGSGGHSFSWPANSVGGCTINSAAGSTTQQMFVYNGTNATAVGPCVSGGSIFVGAITATSIVDLGALTVDGFSLLNGFLGCVEGTAPTPVSGEDLAWCDSGGHRWGLNNDGGTNDFFVGEATTDTFTNKTFDTAGTGNVLKINGNQVTAATGTGGSSQTAVLNGNPTLAGWNCAITTKTALYTLTGADCIVEASVSGGGFTLTLPHAIVGQDWEITRTDSTSNTLTIAGDSGNVNGVASITLASNSSLRCHADGTNSFCHTSTGPLNLFTQVDTEYSASGTGSFTFTYTHPYSAAPACFCTALSSGDAGTGGCNISGTPSTTQCRINIGDSATGAYIQVIGKP